MGKEYNKVIIHDKVQYAFREISTKITYTFFDKFPKLGHKTQVSHSTTNLLIKKIKN